MLRLSRGIVTKTFSVWHKKNQSLQNKAFRQHAHRIHFQYPYCMQNRTVCKYPRQNFPALCARTPRGQSHAGALDQAIGSKAPALIGLARGHQDRLFSSQSAHHLEILTHSRQRRISILPHLYTIKANDGN